MTLSLFVAAIAITSALLRLLTPMGALAGFAVGVAVVVTLLAAGGERAEITGYRWAWAWIAGAYFASSVAIMIGFPAGSSQDREALAESQATIDRSGIEQ